MMDKITVFKDGVFQEIKHRHLQNFLDRGWQLPEGKKVSAANYKIEATADVIEEDDPLEEEEDNWTYSLDDVSSMPEDEEKGED